MNKRFLLTATNTIEMVKEPIPEPPAGGMIVKIHYAGVCHSDVHIWQDQLKLDEKTVVPFSSIPNFAHPRVLGHELAGEVFSFGEGGYQADKSLEKGDKVLIYPWLGCTECEHCKQGNNHYCELCISGTLGVTRDGGYQNYCAVSGKDIVFKLPADANMKEACMLTCSALTSYNGVTRADNQIKEGIENRGFGRVLVMGAGGLGLWAIQWVKSALPQPCEVYVADVLEDKFKDALEMGATGCVHMKIGAEPDEMAALAKEKAGGAFDAAIDLVGMSSTAHILHKALRPGGILVEIGMAGGTMTLPIAATLFTSRLLYFVCVGGPKQLKTLTDLWVEGKVKAPEVTVYEPERLVEVLTMLKEGKMKSRGVLDFTH